MLGGGGGGMRQDSQKVWKLNFKISLYPQTSTYDAELLNLVEN